MSLWSVEEKLEIKVDSAGNLNVGKDASVSVELEVPSFLRGVIFLISGGVLRYMTVLHVDMHVHHRIKMYPSIRAVSSL